MPIAVTRFLRSRWLGVLLVVALLLGWQEGSLSHRLDPVFIPPVSVILQAWIGVIRDGSMTDALLGTLQRFAIGYALAVVIGATVGLVMGYWRTMYALLEPLVELLRPLPSPAIVPICILLLGIEDRMKITVIVFAACFSVLVNTMQGVRGVDPVLVDTAHVFGYRGVSIIGRVVLPAALPSIVAGMRISLAVALIVTVIAEMLAGSAGIGFFILDMQRSFRIPEMYAGIFTLAGLGYMMNWLFVLVERRALHWFVARREV